QSTHRILVDRGDLEDERRWTRAALLRASDESDEPLRTIGDEQHRAFDATQPRAVGKLGLGVVHWRDVDAAAGRVGPAEEVAELDTHPPIGCTERDGLDRSVLAVSQCIERALKDDAAVDRYF